MQYFPWGRPRADGKCSDRECPCPPPGTPLPRGTGYLFVEKPGDSWRATLMCKMGAMKRNLDLGIAAADAEHWWATGEAPCRATPLAKSAQIKASRRSYSFLLWFPAVFRRRSTCGHRMAIHRCSRCGLTFCAECLEKHAERIAQISNQAMGEILGSLAAGVHGNVRVIDGSGKAWCPKCVRTLSQMKDIHRSVAVTGGGETSEDEGTNERR